MRFHIGVSFRPKQLLKWLLPIAIALGILSFSDLVKADTTLNYTQNNVNDMTICDTPVTDYLDMFERMMGYTDMYTVYVSSTLDQYIDFTFVPNLYSHIDLYSSKVGNTNFLLYLFDLNDTSSDTLYKMFNSSFVLQYRTNGNTCNNISIFDNVSALNELLDLLEDYDTNLVSYDFSTLSSTEFLAAKNGSTSIVGVAKVYNRNNMYSYAEGNESNYFVYTSKDTIYQDSELPSAFSSYGSHYPTYINGELLIDNQIIDYDYHYSPTLDFTPLSQYFPSFYAFLNKNELSSFSLNFHFLPDDSDFSQYNFMHISRAYGVTYSNNMYTFTPISCTIPLVSYAIGSDGYLDYGFSSVSCSSDLSNYTYVSLDFDVYSNNNISYKISNLSYTSSLSSSNLYVNNNHFNIVGEAFIPFSNLNTQYAIFISSSNDSYNLNSSVISDNRYTYFKYYSINPFSEMNPVYNGYYGDNNVYYLSYGLVLNKGYLVTHDNIIDSNNSNLNLFVDPSSYVYLNSNFSGNSQICYFYNNSVECSSIIVDFSYSDSDSDYDLDYYFSSVTSYIDSITNDMVNFGSLVQQVYNTIPTSIQFVIFILFILGNTYILLKLIRR